MEIIHLNEVNLAAWQRKARRNVMALGFFDGMHKGHQEVVETAKQTAGKKGIPVDVMSFFPHPKTVLSNGKEIVEYLMPLEEKARILEGMGVDRFYIVEFTKTFASLGPEEYLEKYLLNFKTVHAVAGFDFSYGFKGAGTIDRLHRDSNYRITVSKVPKVQYRQEKISSTRIRAAITGGEISVLKQMLGRCYTTRAVISQGCLELKEHYMLPQDGIYEVMVETGDMHRRAEIHVDRLEQRITCIKDCFLKQIDQREIAITWERRVAAHSYAQLVAQ